MARHFVMVDGGESNGGEEALVLHSAPIFLFLMIIASLSIISIIIFACGDDDKGTKRRHGGGDGGGGDGGGCSGGGGAGCGGGGGCGVSDISGNCHMIFLYVENHKAIVSKITMKLRNSDKAKEHLNRCLYYVNIGSNDYINNYFLPKHYNSSQTFSTDQFAKALIKEYSRNLMELRSLGARKFAFIGLLPIGSIPGEISTHENPGSLCVKEEK
ncbi:hypothetical protein V8G54_023735 [Vigna mungo]|uniref:Uncharacterized protein n=1 Tax=Vigna mungo TaxID=3915 RepID=A0AAQ3RSI2_VIGMU